MHARSAITRCAAGIAVLAATGCGSALQAADGPGESLLELLTVRGGMPATPGEAVAWAADTDNADRRLRGILSLARAPFGGEDVYIRAYRDAMTDSDPAVRATAVRAMAMHGRPNDADEVVAILGATPIQPNSPQQVRVLHEADEIVRREAARALQRLHRPEIVGALVQAAQNDPDADTRVYCAQALGQYASTQAVWGLIKALGDQRLAVNDAARTSLRTLTGEDFRLDIGAWTEWMLEANNPFADATAYQYPAFSREPLWWEWVAPYLSWPSNEIPAQPAGIAGSELNAAQK